MSVENTKFIGAKTSEQGLHKSRNISNGYEEIDQFDEGKISCGPHQLPANLAGSQTSTKSPKDKMHPYDVVTQPTGGNAVPNDQTGTAISLVGSWVESYLMILLIKARLHQ